MRAGASWGNFFVYTPTNTWKLLIQASIEVIFLGFVTGSIHEEGAVSLAAFWTVIWYWLSKTWFVRSEPKSTYSWPQILVRNLSDKRASTGKLTDWNNWPGMWGAVVWNDCCGRPVMAAASFCRLPCTIFLAKASTGVGAVLSGKGPTGTTWRSDVGTGGVGTGGVGAGGVGAGANRRETSSATLFTRVSINWLDNSWSGIGSCTSGGSACSSCWCCSTGPETGPGTSTCPGWSSRWPNLTLQWCAWSCFWHDSAKGKRNIWQKKKKEKKW